MDKASEAILALKPVTFRYKHELDPNGIPQFGLVAEDVEKVNPDLVARDDQGKPYTVRYEAVNAMLLNEFLKEHRKVEQQRRDFEAALAQQQKQIEALTAGLQKVSAQLELNRRAPQTLWVITKLASRVVSRIGLPFKVRHGHDCCHEISHSVLRHHSNACARCAKRGLRRQRHLEHQSDQQRLEHRCELDAEHGSERAGRRRHVRTFTSP